MIDKKLVAAVPESHHFIGANVAFQWGALVANLVLMAAIARLLAALFSGQRPALAPVALLAAACVAARALCTLGASEMSDRAARVVKQKLRAQIYQKLLALGPAYRTQVNTSEVIQVTVEGVDQLETYFGAYLPQFFYALLAPLTLFAVLCFVSWPCALALLVCVPLIPVSIAAVQTWAKKLLARYWDQYTALGDTFLENLQGMTTLKIYNADEQRQQQMNAEAEGFRRITMRVLSMQLNSITVMDVVAYGGAALGMILAVLSLRRGTVGLAGCLFILLISADFFLPMRQLGSFFHVAMNGMAASGNIFRLLELPTDVPPAEPVEPASCEVVCRGLCYTYPEGTQALHNVSLRLPVTGFVAVVGASGSGKSTLAGLLCGRLHGYKGTATLGGVPLCRLPADRLLQTVTYVGHDSYLFKGSVRENLCMARPDAPDADLWQVLEQVRLAEFLRTQQGLDTPLSEQGGNFSGGQRQRLAIARALLHDSPLYLFDEASSNVDADSEDAILLVLHQLAQTRSVLMISHRLANAQNADCIYVMQAGRVCEQGRHQQLLACGGAYAALWHAQQELERYNHADGELSV